MTVSPVSTLPALRTRPERASIRSVNVVLPASTWANMPMFRSDSRRFVFGHVGVSLLGVDEKCCSEMLQLCSLLIGLWKLMVGGDCKRWHCRRDDSDVSVRDVEGARCRHGASRRRQSTVVRIIVAYLLWRHSVDMFMVQTLDGS